MLRKRLIGVVTLKEGRAVQSFGYGRWLPLGSAECVVENLNRWGADEILVLATDRSRQRLGPDLDLIRRLGELGLCTPIAYGGGIRSAEDGVKVVHAGADRVVVDAILHRDPLVAHALANRLGAQAVIAALPLAFSDGKVRWLDHVNRRQGPLLSAALNVIAARDISEVLVVDWRHEGHAGTFDVRLLDSLPDALAQVPRIAFGGIGVPRQCEALLRREDISAVALGNLLNYHEHAIQACKVQVSGTMLRPPEYEGAEEDA
jgi:imidazole glycerol-phosphate synthase subunit HisF